MRDAKTTLRLLNVLAGSHDVAPAFLTPKVAPKAAYAADRETQYAALMRGLEDVQAAREEQEVDAYNRAKALRRQRAAEGEDGRREERAQHLSLAAI